MGQELENILRIILAAGSLTTGAFLTALRAKITSTKTKNFLHISFYLVSAIVFIGAILTLIKFWNLIFTPNLNALVTIGIAILSSIALFWVTKSFLLAKNEYTSKALDPVVNKFSQNADKDNIKLLAGNLDFFGKSEPEIAGHPQYVTLKQCVFREIQILCTKPNTLDDKRRYGQIITDFPNVQLRYYKPTNADLKVRGRIKTLNNVTRLLIYSKVGTEKYEAIELDTAESTGALYSHLWQLIWSLALKPSTLELDEYRRIYRPQKV